MAPPLFHLPLLQRSRFGHLTSIRIECRISSIRFQRFSWNETSRSIYSSRHGFFFSLPEARKMNRSERISGGRAPDFVTHVNGSRRFKRCLSKEFVVENSFAVELIEHKIDSSEEIQISGIMESIGCSTDKCLAVSVLFEKIAPRRSIDDLAQELRPWLWNENSLKIQFASIPLARKI